MWFSYYQEYENCAMEYSQVKIEDGWTDKDNNFKVFAPGFLTCAFGLSLPPLLPCCTRQMGCEQTMTEMKKHEMSRDKMNEWKDEGCIFLEKYANIHLFAYNILCINLYI